jgi:hypothetical protein
MNVGWSDLGSWSALRDAWRDAAGPRAPGYRRAGQSPRPRTPRQPGIGRRPPRSHDRLARRDRRRHSRSSARLLGGARAGCPKIAQEYPNLHSASRQNTRRSLERHATPAPGTNGAATTSPNSDYEPPGSCSAPTAGGPRSPTSTTSSTSGAAPRPWRSTWSPAASSQGHRLRLRPALRQRALREGGRRSRPGPRHPDRLRRAGPADADVLVRGRPAQGRGRHRDHRQPQPLDRQRLQDQVADGRGGRAGDARPTSRRGSPPAPVSRSRPGRSPMPRPPASSSSTTRSTPIEVHRHEPRSRPPPCRRRRSAGRPALRLRAGWIPRLLAGGKIRVTEIHSERNPYFGGVNPSRSRPTSTRPCGPSPTAASTWACCSTATRTGPGTADERGNFVTTLQIYALLMYYLAEHRGLRQPVVKTVNETSMAERLGERYGVEVHEVPVGFKYVGPKMIETGAMMGGEESGGLWVRDAPARARRHLHRPDAAGPFPAREGCRPLAGLKGDRPPPRDRRPFELPPCGRPFRSGGLSGAQGSAPRRAAAAGARGIWPAGRSYGPRRSPPTTASSSSPTTDRGC